MFSHALPQLESVFTYGSAAANLVQNLAHFDYAYRMRSPGDNPKFRSLRNQRLQVVTKIVDYELGPGQTFEGVWHVEGMSHEEIVATAIYFLHRDEEIDGGNIKLVDENSHTRHVWTQRRLYIVNAHVVFAITIDKRLVNRVTVRQTIFP